MLHTRIYTGSDNSAGLFRVYLCALRGKKALKFTVAAQSVESRLERHASDNAVAQVFKHEKNAPKSAFVAVYAVDVTPPVSSKYGAQMGRHSGSLDHDSYATWKAVKVSLSQGYDKGGVYWGNRALGRSLYAVQDGMGNIAYVDAQSNKLAIAAAKED